MNQDTVKKTFEVTLASGRRQITVTVDLGKLARYLGSKAVNSSSGVSKVVGGAVVVQALPVEVRP